MISSILDLDTQTNQYFYDSGYSDSPSPGSSSTSSRMICSPTSNNDDEFIPNNLHYLNLGDSINQHNPYNTYKLNQVPIDFQNQDKPQLVITEQPVDKFRFRYKSEMHGTHGSLMGERNEKSKRTYPTVELRNYYRKALIRCSLYQTDNLKRLPHSHKLVVRNGDEDQCDPHDLFVSPEEGFRAVFQGMGIIHTAKKFIIEELILKKIKEKKFELGRELTTREISQIKISADKEAKDMNLNQVCLAFHAYQINTDGTLSKLCEPVFSRPINNMKSALTGELKIVRMSAVVSSAAGDEDLFLLVEKVGKKNIKVRFYEIDQDDEVVWEEWGKFSEADVHHQYAIALRTPPYKQKNIDGDVEVYIQLERPSDGVRSEPLPFKYKPRDFVLSRKKARMSSSSSSSLNSSELPEIIRRNINDNNNMEQKTQNQPLTLSEEFNKSEEIEKLIGLSNYDSGNVPDDLKEFMSHVRMDSDDLIKVMDTNFFDSPDLDGLSTDGISSTKAFNKKGIESQIDVIEPQMQAIDISIFQTGIKPQMQMRVEPQMRTNNRPQIQTRIIPQTQMNVKPQQRLSGELKAKNAMPFLEKLKLQQRIESKPKTAIPFLEKMNSEWYHGYFKKIMSILRSNVLTQDYQKAQIEIGKIFEDLQNKNNDLLQCAIRDGKSDIVLHLLKCIEKFHFTHVLNYKNDDNQNCLHIACMFDRPECIRMLIQLGADPNSPDKNGNTPLHIAIENNFDMCATKIIEKSNYDGTKRKLEINYANYDGLTPLHLAIRKGNFNIVKKIIEDGNASVKLLVSKDGNNPLHIAVQQNDENIVKYLLESTSVRVNEENLSGYTPLKLASVESLPGITNLLLKYGGKYGGKVDVDKPNLFVKYTEVEIKASLSDNDDNTTDSKLSAEDDDDDDDDDDDNDDDNDNENNEGQLKTDKNRSSEKIVLFDDICIEQFVKIFNVNDKWKNLANLLKLDYFTYVWTNDDNPTKQLFHLINLEIENLKIDDILNAFKKLNEYDAIKCIHEMKKRRN